MEMLSKQKQKSLENGDDISPDSPISSPEVSRRQRRRLRQSTSSPINQKLMDPSSMSPATSVAAGIVFFPNILELHLSGITLPLPSSPRSDPQHPGMGDPHTLQYPDSEHKSEVRVTQIHERTERSLLDQNHIFSQTSFLQQQQLQQSQQSQPQQHCNSQLILGMESVGLGLGVGGETEAHMQSLIPTQYDYTATDYSNYNSFPDYSQSMEQIPIQVDPSTNPSMLYTHHNPNESYK
jgi:hypothetical protein